MADLAALRVAPAAPHALARLAAAPAPPVRRAPRPSRSAQQLYDLLCAGRGAEIRRYEWLRLVSGRTPWLIGTYAHRLADAIWAHAATDEALDWWLHRQLVRRLDGARGVLRRVLAERRPPGRPSRDFLVERLAAGDLAALVARARQRGCTPADLFAAEGLPVPKRLAERRPG